MTNEASRSPRANLVFSALLTLWIILVVGPLYGLILWVVIVPLANLVFQSWGTGTPIYRIISITARGLLLTVALFCAQFLFVKLVGTGGQLGYGDALQIKGREITWLGYQTMLIASLKVSAAAWVAAAITSSVSVRRSL